MSFTDKSWSLSSSFQKASSLFQKVISLNHLKESREDNGSPDLLSPTSVSKDGFQNLYQNGLWKDTSMNDYSLFSDFSNSEQISGDKVFQSASNSPSFRFIPTFTIKILICGGPNVGKTTVLEILDKKFQKFSKQMKKETGGKLGQNTFQPSGQVTNIGPQILTYPLESILTKKSSLPSKYQYFVQFIDIPHSLYNSSYLDSFILKEIHGAVIMFDISDPKSIYAVDQWRKRLYQKPYFLKHILLIGHKAEKKPHILSPKDMTSYIRDSHFIKWYMTSSRWKGSVEDAISYLLNRIIRYWKKNHSSMAPGSNIENEKSQESISSKVEKEVTSKEEFIDENVDSYNLRMLHMGNEILEELMEQSPFTTLENLHQIITDDSTNTKIEIVISFRSELVSFYSILRERFKEYQLSLENQKKYFDKHSFSIFCLNSEHIDLLISEMKREEDAAIDKLENILSIYEQTNEETLNLRCKKQFAQIIRQFFTGPVERWTNLWHAIRSFMFLHNNINKMKDGSISDSESTILSVLPSCIEDLISQLKEDRLIIKSNNSSNYQNQEQFNSNVNIPNNGNFKFLHQTLDLESYEIQYHTIHSVQEETSKSSTIV